MRKLTTIALISIALNIALSAWLVNNYFYDSNFRGWVDYAIGHYYPYIVLSIGLGGGSGLGYLLLRRRSVDHSITGKLQRTKPFRHGPTSEESKSLLTIAPSTEATKHTAYSVPPLPRISPSSNQPTPSTGWAAGSKTSTMRTNQPPGILPASSSSHLPAPPLQVPRSESSMGGFKIPRSDQIVTPGTRAIPESQPRFPSSPPWRPEPRPGAERKFEPAGPLPKQGGETGPRPIPPAPGQPTEFQRSKWQPPDSSVRPIQRLDNIPREGYSAPKWLPPAGQSPKSSEGFPQKPNPFAPQRAPFGPPQPPPRPVAYPGGTRPTGIGAPIRPKPTLPDQARPPGGNLPRTAIQKPSVGTPTGPQKPQAPLAERKLGATETPDKPGPRDVTVPEQPNSLGSQLKTDAGPVPPGELDWDTALDTILKTLRKDKVETK